MGTRAAEPIPIVIDTDIGADPDDALALVFALASPELDVRGVTVVDGDVDLRARMAARLLGMAGRPDVPVFRGLRQPIGHGRGPTMLGFEGRGLLDLDYDGPEAIVDDTPAAEWLVAESTRAPFHLVAIGPLSNAAAALRLGPTLANRLLGLTIMGGLRDERALPLAWQQALHQEGRAAAWPDHNTASDPLAALACAGSGAAVTWITTEITLGVPLRRRARERLPRNAPLGLALGRMLDVWNDEWFQSTMPEVDGPPSVPIDTVALLHDPLTVAALFPSDWLTLANVRLSYGIQNGLFRLGDSGGNNGVPARVAVRADGAGFEAFCVERIVRYIGRLQGNRVRS